MRGSALGAGGGTSSWAIGGVVSFVGGVVSASVIVVGSSGRVATAI